MRDKNCTLAVAGTVLSFIDRDGNDLFTLTEMETTCLKWQHTHIV